MIQGINGISKPKIVFHKYANSVKKKKKKVMAAKQSGLQLK